MKLVFFGNLFVRSDEVENIISHLNDTIDHYENLKVDLIAAKASTEALDLYLEFLMDIRSARE